MVGLHEREANKFESLLWHRATIACMEGQLPNIRCMERGQLEECLQVRQQQQLHSTHISNSGKGAVEQLPLAILLLDRPPVMVVSITHNTSFSIHPSTLLPATHSIMVHPCLLHLHLPCNQVCTSLTN